MRVLITGVRSQDGFYISAELLRLGHEVIGTSRSKSTDKTFNGKFQLPDGLKLIALNLEDANSVNQHLRYIQPDWIIHLSAQSSVGYSFQCTAETYRSIITTTINLLEAQKLYLPKSKLLLASSSECFGECTDPADEETPFSPKSPYAVAKASASNILKNYRECFGQSAFNLYLFNHESPFRKNGFVTHKLVTSAVNIYEGKESKVCLGSLDVFRDWIWASDVADAITATIKNDVLLDMVIASGQAHSLRDFAKVVFSEFGLNFDEYYEIDKQLVRKNDIFFSFGNPAKAMSVLNWRPKIAGLEVAQRLVHEIKEVKFAKK